MDYLGINFSSQKLIELKEQLNNTVKEINRTLAKRERLIECKSYTDAEQQRLNSYMNPEDYYKFRYMFWGCEIVYTHWTINKETGHQYQDRNKYYYGIRYYGVDSKLFKSDRLRLDKLNGEIYGSWNSLDEAISYFKKAVVDILVQAGCIALDPLDFL